MLCSSWQGFIASFERSLEHTKHKGSRDCSLQGATVNPNFKYFQVYCLTNFPFRFSAFSCSIQNIRRFPFYDLLQNQNTAFMLAAVSLTPSSKLTLNI